MNDTDKQEVLAAVEKAIRGLTVGRLNTGEINVAQMNQLADRLTEQAEAAEGREKCQRGEHDKEDCGLETFHEYSIIMVKCRRCDWIAREANVNPAPPADVTREDVEYHLANWRGADTTSAVQRAMIRRVFADVLEGK